jgi:hypothetical protein
MNQHVQLVDYNYYTYLQVIMILKTNKCIFDNNE